LTLQQFKVIDLGVNQKLISNVRTVSTVFKYFAVINFVCDVIAHTAEARVYMKMCLSTIDDRTLLLFRKVNN